MAELSKSNDQKFAVFAEVDGYDRDLVQTHLTFGRLVDDVVVPYESGVPFFIDGAPVKRDAVRRLKILRQTDTFAFAFDHLHRNLRRGASNLQKIIGDQYHVRLEAALREGGEDVTSQVIKAFDRAIKPRIKDYLPKREELIRSALEIFMKAMSSLGSG